MARTLSVMSMKDIGNRQPGMFGKATLSLTASDSTTAVVRIGGLPFGRLKNVSGGSITLTFKELHLDEGEDPTTDGTVVDLEDEDTATNVYTWTLANNRSRQLPTSLAGVDWLLIKLSTGTADVVLSLER